MTKELHLLIDYFQTQDSQSKLLKLIFLKICNMNCLLFFFLLKLFGSLKSFFLFSIISKFFEILPIFTRVNEAIPRFEPFLNDENLSFRTKYYNNNYQKKEEEKNGSIFFSKPNNNKKEKEKK